MINFLKNQKIAVIIMLALIILPSLLWVVPALAAPNLGLNYVDTELNLATADPRTAVIGLIALIMTFLGIIAVVMVLYGGFVWLTAAGNEENVSRAKKIITAAIIGLVIILAAYLIINFVEENVSNALNG